MENLKSLFQGKFAGPDSQDMITKHMPKSFEKPDLAGSLKHKHNIAHKVIVQETSFWYTVG